MIIVADSAPLRLGRRALDDVGTAAGGAIVGLSVVAFAMGIILVVPSHGELSLVDALGALALCLAGAGVGMRIVRGRRYLVLFLRRFGFAPATNVVSNAVATAFGRRWRLVTLDDDEVEPLAPNLWPRLLGVAAALAAAVVLVVAMIESPPSSGGLEADDASVATEVAESIVLLVWAWYVFTGLTFMAAGVLLGGSHLWFVAQARKDSHHALHQVGQLAPRVRRIHKRARRTIAPTFFVVKVVDEIWREAVRQLTVPSTVVVIDISEPSKSLIWEIEMLKNQDTPALLIGDAARVSRMIELDDVEPRATPQARLRALLDGAEVLVYEPDDRSDMRRFRRLLRHRCEDHAPSRLRQLLPSRTTRSAPVQDDGR